MDHAQAGSYSDCMALTLAGALGSPSTNQPPAFYGKHLPTAGVFVDFN